MRQDQRLGWRLAGRLGLVLATACGITRCTTGGQPPATDVAGVGDIAFRLQWDGPADLDLSVVEPSGEKIWFGARRSTTGGVLDVDCNALPNPVCPHPIENIFWAKGTAPVGTYRYMVGLANARGAAFPIPFTIAVLHGRQIFLSERAEIPRPGEVWGPKDARWGR